MFTTFTDRFTMVEPIKEDFVTEKKEAICIHCTAKEIEARWIAVWRSLDEAGLLPEELREMLAVMTDPAVSSAVKKIYREEMKALPIERQLELVKRASQRLIQLTTEVSDG